MNKRKKIIVPTVILTLVMALTLICGVIAVAGADAKFDSKVELADRYAVGTRINIPSAKLRGSSGALETTVKVVCPNGEEVTGNSFTVENKGTHRVVYKAVENGTEISEEFVFEGYYPLYSVDKKASDTPYYGASEKYGGIEGRDGVVVSLASGDTFRWGEIIDLNGKTELDSLIKLYVTPNNPGTADAAKLCIVLTDIHDPDNYVTVTFKKVTAVMVGAQWAEINTFVTAGAADQLQSGMRENESGAISYEGKLYNIEAGTKMGTEITALSLPGTPMYVQGDESSVSWEHFKSNPQLLTVSIDYSNSKVYAGRIDADETDPAKAEDVKFVADLDSEACFDTLWGGFTTGEVYLSIKGQEYLSSSLNFVITEVNGESVAEKVKDGKNEVADLTPPALTVDFPETIPQGVIGVKYPLFSATATDIYDGEIIPTVAVTYNREPVEVKDGAFIPTAVGTYTVTYRATDYSGNYTRDSLYSKKVTVVEGEGLSVTLGDAAADGYVTGSAIPVAAYSAVNARGEVKAEISATLIKNASGAAVADGAEYSVENGVFVPLEVGTYRIEYKVSDHLFTRLAGYEIKVAQNSGAVIVDVPDIPRYYISGMVYNTPSLKGYYWESNVLKEIDCTVSYSSDGVTYKNAGTLFTPVGDGVSYIKFTAVAGGKSAEQIYKVATVDVGYNQNKLMLDKYFRFTQGSAISEAGEDKSIKYLLEGNASFDYVNLLQSERFSFEFSANGVSGVTVTLTDVSGKVLVIKYTYLDGGKTEVEITGDSGTKTVTMDYDINDEEKGTQRVSYSNETMTLNVTSKRAVALSGIFSGFDGNVWMSVDVIAEAPVALSEGESEHEAAPSISIYTLNEQRFAVLRSDDRIPPLVLVDIATGERKLGDVYRIGRAVITDVLDSYVTAYMYVLTPSGEFAVAQDGTVLDYKADITREYDIDLSEYGKYIIYYYAKDSAGNETNYTVQISVVDAEAPVITTEEHDRYLRVGDKIVPADFTVSDNVSSAEEMITYVYIIAPDGSAMTDGEARATLKGVYQIRYYAIDAQGNCSILSFNVTAY